MALFAEKKRTAAIVFALTACVWALVVRPGILNRCQLTLWLLLFEAARNLCCVVETHATPSWAHAAGGRVFGLCQQPQ